MPAVAAAPDHRRTLAILHDIPGRLRVRLPAAVRAAGIEEAATAVPGVVACAWSDRTRSLLVRYRPDATSAAAVVDAIVLHAGLDRHTVAAASRSALTRPTTSRPVATAVRQGITDLNAAVRGATRNTLDLSDLLPLGLAAWAVFEIVRGRVGPLAWSSALWYAHGLFRDYSLPTAD